MNTGCTHGGDVWFNVDCIGRIPLAISTQNLERENVAVSAIMSKSAFK